jgi:hypothetical protein
MEKNPILYVLRNPYRTSSLRTIKIMPGNLTKIRLLYSFKNFKYKFSEKSARNKQTKLVVRIY